jgi:predicted ribosomally synthesized peptide with nif11-like leader
VRVSVLKKISEGECKMSALEITRFNKDISENMEMLEALKNIGNDVQEIVAYANSKGYDFTVADVEASVQKGELSEEQLDKVAGGVVLGEAKAVLVG